MYTGTQANTLMMQWEKERSKNMLAHFLFVIYTTFKNNSVSWNVLVEQKKQCFYLFLKNKKQSTDSNSSRRTQYEQVQFGAECSDIDVTEIYIKKSQNISSPKTDCLLPTKAYAGGGCRILEKKS